MAQIIQFPKNRTDKDKGGNATIKVDAIPTFAEEVEKEEYSARMRRIMQSLQNINNLMTSIKGDKNEPSK
jgi:hypothetical protein